MNSSTNSSYISPLILFSLNPLYSSCARNASFSVPTSMHTDITFLGSTPPNTVYNIDFPSQIPIPFAPKSPKPKIRSPSVTTATFTSSLSFSSMNFLNFAPTLPTSPLLMNNPKLVFVAGNTWYFSHASPTVGVYTNGKHSIAFAAKTRYNVKGSALCKWRRNEYFSIGRSFERKVFNAEAEAAMMILLWFFALSLSLSRSRSPLLSRRPCSRSS
mmetsp:Transcript_7168/g.22304  ORF Transcript_7168/g.22304 Transcript_7168/m.22304 type:complete len:215 (+) Transcript_7168:1875-2519(+)